MTIPTPSLVEILGTSIFAIAVIHTFSVKLLQNAAHHFHENSVMRSLLHLASEIEVVFGIWAGIFLAIVAVLLGPGVVVQLQSSMKFTEPIFVFCIMAISATKPTLWLVRKMVMAFSHFLHKVFRMTVKQSDLMSLLILTPLMGSFITEPAAMTVAALLLRSMIQKVSSRFMYALLAVLFVNISIGGSLTPYAAPPILMVASKWEWTFQFVFLHFGVKSFLAVVGNAVLIFVLFKNEIESSFRDLESSTDERRKMPIWIVAMHYLLLAMLVLCAHYPNLVMGIFMMFLGLTTVTKRHQDELKLRESLLVAFFLAGIIVFGSFQSWWLQPMLTSLNEMALFFGATALTAVTDNAALTYLGSQVEGLSEASKYYLVAGAIAGGGLTVIANAPNAAGYNILQAQFPGGMNPLALLKAAAIPTLIAVVCLGFLPI